MEEDDCPNTAIEEENPQTSSFLFWKRTWAALGGVMMIITCIDI